MRRYPYNSEEFKLWRLCSVVTLASVAALLALFMLVGMAVMFLLLACCLHLLFMPTYMFREKLGHPSWVMVPSLLPISAVVPFFAAYLAPLWFYTTTGFALSTLVPLPLWVPFLVYKPTMPKGIILVGCLVLALAVPTLEATNSRGRFLRDLYRVQPGMTIEEVETIMTGYIRGTGFPPNPYSAGPEDILVDVGTGRRFVTADTPDGEMEIVGARVYRHSNDGAYNADWGIVRFENGRVVSITFSQD